jgi:hypothetical protein
MFVGIVFVLGLWVLAALAGRAGVKARLVALGMV